jgi:predicted ArsR family transcriptional regulator
MTMTARSAANPSRTDVESIEQDSGTREQVLHLIVSRGPIAAGDLATALNLTAPAIRRHLTALEADGHIVARQAPGAAKRGRGRPARFYVATESAHESLPSAYADLAIRALAQLAEVAGDGALVDFARTRSETLASRYAAGIDVAGPDPAARARALAHLLAEDGYEATTRPVAGTRMLQLCQGHCPVVDVAAAFPQLCEAETQVFSRLLGVHVQRLATLATGAHACTTNVPTGRAPIAAIGSTSGTPTISTPISTSPTPVEGPR